MRNFTVIDVEQRSEAWIQARIGRLTASRAADLLATLKSNGEAAGRRNLRVQLVLERITGRSQENNYQSQAMLDGISREPAARAYYEAATGELLTTTGFLAHTQHAAGCSLDGHVGDFEGIIEIKCPLAATHLDVIRSGKVPGDYQKQIVHQLWISGAQWCDWMSYHSEFPEPLTAKIVRVPRADVDIAAYEKAALAFLAEVDTEVAALQMIINPLQVLQEALA